MCRYYQHPCFVFTLRIESSHIQAANEAGLEQERLFGSEGWPVKGIGWAVLDPHSVTRDDTFLLDLWISVWATDGRLAMSKSKRSFKRLGRK